MAAAKNDRDRFPAMFTELSPRLFLYARRHCDPAAAQDVVSDTFLVAWRRWSDVPDNPLPWLLVVARNTIANRQRSDHRQTRVADAMRRIEHLAGHADGVDEDVIERDCLLAGLGTLSDIEREALLLVAWDGCTAAQAARVAGCSVRAFEVRLSRARARLIRAMREPDTHPSPAVLSCASVTGAAVDRKDQ